MLCSEIIKKKRDGGKLLDQEIEFVVKGAAQGSLPDYQISAWLMACFLRGLDAEETLVLTRAIKESGESLEWRKLSTHFTTQDRFVDKHSTGGVGDKVSLVLAPLVACFGLKVPMMSGRGLGFTGGTVDKLESIAGFSMYPDRQKMVAGLHEVGTIMMAQAADLCPADKKLYALRDVTATIENHALITGSIVSKKWAEGVDAIVFDVKCGHGAFMENLDGARELAQSLVRVAKLAGMKARACLTRMDEPLGAFIGNVLEVKESLYILTGKYPSAVHARIAAPLRKLCVRLSAEMVVLSGFAKNLDEAQARAEEFLNDGRAHQKFLQMCEFQGARVNWGNLLGEATKIVELRADRDGFVNQIFSRSLGLVGQEIGVGRKSMEDELDPVAGFELLKARGDGVKTGETLVKIHLGPKGLGLSLAPMLDQIRSAFEIVPLKPSGLPTDLWLEGIS